MNAGSEPPTNPESHSSRSSGIDECSDRDAESTLSPAGTVSETTTGLRLHQRGTERHLEEAIELSVCSREFLGVFEAHAHRGRNCNRTLDIATNRIDDSGRRSGALIRH